MYPVAGALVVLAVAQVVLPPIATSVVRSRLGSGAKITSIKLTAVPAIELLWEHVGSLQVKLERYELSPQELVGQLRQSGDVSTLEVSIGVLRTGPLTLHDVELRKRDGRLTLQARLDTSDLRAALPVIQSLTPVPGPRGELTLRGTASLLGASVSATAVIAAQDGKVVVTPQGLLGAFATITVFNDPDVHVDTVSGHAVPGGLQITATAGYS